MTCCPQPPNISVAEYSVDEPTAGAEVERIPGESDDCYNKRVGNTSATGQVDDKTEPTPDKIKQNSVVPDGQAHVNITFETTGPTPVTSWVFDPTSFPGVTTAGGTLSGTFDASVHHNKLTLRVKAMSGSTVIDDRTYNFSPSLYDDKTSIRLQHPLPGAIVTSGFGPRNPPASGASSNHLALDFAYGDHGTKDAICAADGEVVHCAPGTGYGNYVVVKHTDPAGKHLVSTLYAHLNTIYVKMGQKLMGGTAVGKEGNTGIGSGPHLHFEVRLPNGTKVDPTPYLAGETLIAKSVNPNNTPNTAAGTTSSTGTGGVTRSEVAARSSCPEFGSDYPAPAAPPPAAPPTGDPAVDAFEKVWEFTLKHEVSPLWMSDGTWNPSNPEVAQGLVATPIQRQHVGFNTNANDPGGSTKFGVAQKYNANIKIADMDYATARTTAFNTYWNASDNPCVGLSPKIAAIVFDMNYSIGVGGSKKVMTDAGVNGTEMLQSELDALDKLTTARIAYLKTKSGWSTFGTGWTKRSNDCLAFAKTV